MPTICKKLHHYIITIPLVLKRNNSLLQYVYQTFSAQRNNRAHKYNSGLK